MRPLSTAWNGLRVKVDVGGETRADAALSLQTMTQSVAVNATAPVLQRDSSALAEVIDNRQVEALPLNGRDFRKLALLAAGSGAAVAARLARLVHREWAARKVEYLPDRRRR